MYKKIICVVIALTIAIALQMVSPLSINANGSIVVVVDGQRITFQDQKPAIINGRVLVPVRAVFEEMGFYPQWYPDTRVAVLMGPRDIITIPVDITFFRVNGRVVTTDVPQQLIIHKRISPCTRVHGITNNSCRRSCSKIRIRSRS